MDELIRILQTAITPVTLISGVGLLLLSMTNRFARTTDRARTLAKDVRNDPHAVPEIVNREIRILYRRSRILLVAISLALGSIFLVSVLIISLFASSIFGLDLHYWAGLLFALSLLALIASLALFIQDMSLSLSALKLELKDHL
jgi:hypothetical protein